MRRLFSKILKNSETQDLSITVYDFNQKTLENKAISYAIDLEELHETATDDEDFLKKLYDGFSRHSLTNQLFENVNPKRSIEGYHCVVTKEPVDGKPTLESEKHKILDEFTYNEMDEVHKEASSPEKKPAQPVVVPKTAVISASPVPAVIVLDEEPPKPTKKEKIAKKKAEQKEIAKKKTEQEKAKTSTKKSQPKRPSSPNRSHREKAVVKKENVPRSKSRRSPEVNLINFAILVGQLRILETFADMRTWNSGFF